MPEANRARTRLWRDAAVVVALGAAYVAVVVGQPGGETVATHVDNVVETAAAFAAAVACWVTARRVEAWRRRPWVLLAVSMASWGLGQAAWTYFESIAGQSPFPSVADVGYLLSVPFAAAAMLTFPSHERRVTLVRVLVDGITVALAALGVSWVLVLGRVVESSGTGLELVLALAYPVGDVVVLVATISALGRAADAYRTTVATIGCGLVLLSVSDSAFVYLQATDAYTTSVANVGWVAGFLVIAVAARHARMTPPRTAHRDQQPFWLLALPYLPMALFVLLAVPTQIHYGHLDDVFTWVGVPLVLLLIVRQALTHHDNAALTEDLHRQIDALAESRERLRRQALHDPLTGLPNRLHLMRELAGRFDGTTAPQSALLLMDLDRFKEINDGLGHHVGDQVLCEIAERLRLATPAGDTVARLGGDEFALLLDDPPGCGRPEAVAEDLLHALEEPVEVDGMTLSVGVSIGVCHSTEASDASSVLQSADVAMYRAKGLATSIAVFGPEDDEDRPGRLVLLNDLRDALDHHELQVAYQPPVDLRSGRVVGMEALARWHHPDRGWIPPDEFIPVAEQTGLIRHLTRQVLTRALAQCAEWRARGWDLSVSVNLSPRALQDPRLARDLHGIILASRLPSRFLTLEVTEGAFAGNLDSLVATLERLRTLGARLSIDDFGTGYSSMSHLKRMPVQELKIDREFVKDLPRDADDRAIVGSIVALARTLDLSVVAEGVEDPVSLDLVRTLGCDVVQGFQVCRPADAATITAWMDGLGRREAAVVPTEPSVTTEPTVPVPAEPSGTATPITIATAIATATATAVTGPLVAAADPAAVQ